MTRSSESLPEVWTCDPCPDRGEGRWLLPEAHAAAAWLTGLGLAPGDRIALGAAPSSAMAGILQAALEMGIPVVLIQGRCTPGEVADLWTRSRARVAISSPGHPLAGIPGALRCPDLLPAAAPPPRHPDLALPGLILFTSGTTGRPKAARLSRRALYASVNAANAHLGLGNGDTWLGCLPLDHIGGAMTVLRQIGSGYRLRLASRFSPDLSFAGVTGVSLVPTHLHRLVARGQPWPSGLRRILTGGGPLAPDLAAACTALGCAPTQTYGLTEHASMATCETVPSGLTAGVPVGCQVRLDGEGRIELAGSSLFDGYENDEGGLIRPFTADGWFPTGDAGVLDAEGRLTVLGRRSDLIITGGENVYPAEIEAVLSRHPAILEVRVRGEADPEWGQVVVADLVAPGVTEADWQAAVAPLAGFKRPRRWRLVPDLPRTSTGKLRRD